MNTLTVYITLFLLTINSINAKETDGCPDKNKNSDGILLLITIIGCAYLYQQHQMHEEGEEYEEEESSGEDESDHSDHSDEEEEGESENSEEEVEDEQDDDDGGDNGHPSEEEGDESEEEAESDGERTAVLRKRRSSRLGSKAMGLGARGD